MATFETTIRYKNLNQRTVVEDNHRYYDSVLIQAHLLAYSKRAVPRLIMDMVEDRSFNYYIDPMISDFRVGTNFRDSDGDLRGWHAIYVDALGDSLRSVLARRSNVDAGQLDDKTIHAIAEDAVVFQEDFVYDRLLEEVGKYEDIPVEREDVQPEAVIPWTHKIERAEDLSTYRKILSASDSKASLPLKPCIYTTTDFARDTTNRTAITELLDEFDVDQCFLVFENLNKYESTEPEYKTVIDLVYDLHQSGASPHFYYGDFFSNLLAYFGLRGTATAPLFDEEFKEKLEYGGSGGPPPRYYVNQLKDFVKVTTAVDVMLRMDAPMCDCEFCERHFESWYDLTDRAEDDDLPLKPILKLHRVALRWRHARLVEDQPLDDVLDGLNRDFAEFVEAYNNSPMKSPSKNLDYLKKWINAVRDRQELAVDRLEQLPA